MTAKQEKLIENYVRNKVRSMLKEESDPVNLLIIKELNNFLKNLESKISNIDNSFDVNSDGKQLGIYLRQLLSIKYK